MLHRGVDLGEVRGKTLGFGQEQRMKKP